MKRKHLFSIFSVFLTLVKPQKYQTLEQYRKFDLIKEVYIYINLTFVI